MILVQSCSVFWPVVENLPIKKQTCPAQAYNGNTALHMAAAQNGRQAQAHAVQLLMRRGADPSAKNLENEQPIQLVPEGSVGDQVSIRHKPGLTVLLRKKTHKKTTESELVVILHGRYCLLQLFVVTVIYLFIFHRWGGSWKAVARRFAPACRSKSDQPPSVRNTVSQAVQSVYSLICRYKANVSCFYETKLTLFTTV